MAGVYLSYPFCAQKCTYCNFASGVFPAALEQQYLSALESELRSFPWQWIPETLYIGGGTPSRIGPEVLHRLASAIPGRPWQEATLEAAPASFAAREARSWRAAGITRVSLGVQSFVDAELRLTGRKHTAAAVAADVDALRDSGIEDINIDLIAGLPRQTRDSWEESLAWIERLAPTHVSVYMLEVDEDSRLGLEILQDGARYGASLRPSEELTVELYERALDRLAELGLHRYEISNFARPGRESLHNLKYWRLEPYAGFGADAHSFDGRFRRSNVDSAAAYVDRVTRGQSPCAAEAEARGREERFFVGLRLSEGVRVDAADWSTYGRPLHRFLDAGLLERRGDRVRLTRHGVLLSNEVFQEFVSP